VNATKEKTVTRGQPRSTTPPGVTDSEVTSSRSEMEGSC